MNTFWELLFLAWVPRYREDMVPDYLKGDPVRAYGQYSFREGVRFGLTLAVSVLNRWGESGSDS